MNRTERKSQLVELQQRILRSTVMLVDLDEVVQEAAPPSLGPWAFPAEWSWYRYDSSTGLRCRRADLGLNSGALTAIFRSEKAAVLSDLTNANGCEIFVIRGRCSVRTSVGQEVISQGGHAHLQTESTFSIEFDEGAILLCLFTNR